MQLNLSLHMQFVDFSKSKTSVLRKCVQGPGKRKVKQARARVVQRVSFGKVISTIRAKRPACHVFMPASALRKGEAATISKGPGSLLALRL